MNKSGQSLVLFVLFLPILIILLIGTIELGNILIAQKELNSITKLCSKSANINQCLTASEITNYQIKEQSLITAKQVKGIIMNSSTKLTSTYQILE